MAAESSHAIEHSSVPFTEASANNAENNVESPGLVYIRSLFSNILEWYKNADTKAHILLGLDGALLAFLINPVFQTPSDLRSVLGDFKTITWIFFGLMCISLIGSIVCALLALWSRISFFGTDVRERMRKEYRVDTEVGQTYVPEVMWFFQEVSLLNRAQFQERISRIENESFEITALAKQVHAVSRNVVKKHYWINWGFLLAGSTLILLLLASASYVARSLLSFLP